MTIDEAKKAFYKPVVYDGIEYTLIECILWYDRKERKYKYSATLLDKTNNCTVRASLDRIELKQG